LVRDNQPLEHEFCFGANSELVARHDRPKPWGSVPKESCSLDMTDYVSPGNIRYSQRLSRRSGPESIDVRVEKWEAVKQFDANVFVAPPNSTVWDWCSTPDIKMPKNAQPQSVADVLTQSFKGTGHLPYLAVYEVVGTDGVAKQITELFSLPQSAMKEFMPQQRHSYWPVHVCNGKPIPYENIFYIWPLLLKLH